MITLKSVLLNPEKCYCFVDPENSRKNSERHCTTMKNSKFYKNIAFSDNYGEELKIFSVKLNFRL